VNPRDLIAYTLDEAVRVTGARQRQIMYWNTVGLFPPSVADEPGVDGRLYSFRDLVGLRTLARLRNEHKLPLQQLRRVDAWLSERYNSPWSSLRFALQGRELVFREPESELTLSASALGQRVIEFSMAEVETEIQAQVHELRARKPEQEGQIVRNRHVLGNAPRLAGTRVPTSAVWSFHKAGYKPDEIIERFPSLSRRDVDAAIAHEQNQERKRSPRTAS
jgi:uncharacterized protein (DUF433 family)